jgi:hypothetical protein
MREWGRQVKLLPHEEAFSRATRREERTGLTETAGPASSVVMETRTAQVWRHHVLCLSNCYITPSKSNICLCLKCVYILTCHTVVCSVASGHPDGTSYVVLLCLRNCTSSWNGVSWNFASLVVTTIFTLNLNSVNQLIFVMVKCGVLFEVRTGFLNNI